jgi:hypothetical protein
MILNLIFIPKDEDTFRKCNTYAHIYDGPNYPFQKEMLYVY